MERRFGECGVRRARSKDGNSMPGTDRIMEFLFKECSNCPKFNVDLTGNLRIYALFNIGLFCFGDVAYNHDFFSLITFRLNVGFCIHLGYLGFDVGFVDFLDNYKSPYRSCNSAFIYRPDDIFCSKDSFYQHLNKFGFTRKFFLSSATKFF